MSSKFSYQKKHKNLLLYGASSQIPIELINIYIHKFDKIFILCREEGEFRKYLKRYQNFKNDHINKIQVFEIELINLNSVLNLIKKEINYLSGVIWYAGMTGNSDKEYLNIELARENLIINFLNPVLIISEISKKIIETDDSFLIIFTSVSGIRGRKKQLYYGCAKGGLISFASAIRQKLYKKKIHVLTVVPGYMDTAPFRLLKRNAFKFLISSPKYVAKKIYIAIMNKKEIIYISPIWRIIMLIVSIIPEKIFKKLNF